MEYNKKLLLTNLDKAIANKNVDVETLKIMKTLIQLKDGETKNEAQKELDIYR